jgi:uncharacterized protein (DUF1800 family)
MNSPSVTGRQFLFTICLSLATHELSAAEANPAPPQISISKTTNGLPQLAFPYPATDQYTVFGATNPAGPYVTPVPGVLSGPTFTVTNPGPRGFYRVNATPMSSNDLFKATVLNRLTYGPSPEDIEHINAIGPEEFIDEQLKPDLIPENLDTAPPIINDPPPPSSPFTNWIRVSDSGTASNTNLFLYLSAAGRVYIDDVRLVLGTMADVGPNLLVNGDFEEPLSNGWKVGGIFSQSIVTNSPTVDGLAASGANCLLLVSTGSGSGDGSSVQQPFALTNVSGQQYTLSFSYLPYPNPGTNVLTARLSGSSTIREVTLPYNGPIPPPPPPPVSPLYSRLTNGAVAVNGTGFPEVTNTLSDLRAYHMVHAVQSKRQLYEILVQFFENHFTTEYQKIDTWFDENFSNAISNSAKRATLAVDLELREHLKFRQALLSPNCNFYDLLKISIESPAMIIYLDTIQNTRAAPNENYGREILELHTMGADNGYVQQDIVELARVWTGWHVTKKDPAAANNPFAPRVPSVTNDIGMFVLNFQPNNHTTNTSKRLFTNVVVEPRFGPFRGGQPYGLTITTNQYPGTNGMAEGYLVANHLANLPQTMEFLCVKLCQVFVHENFEYGVYNYNTPASPEAQLVKECMTAWDTAAADGRKGNIRSVLKAIFDSALFRGHAASRQKIKTPLELAIGAVRALRVSNTDSNSYVSTTADTDGYGLITGLSRMGGMGLFNKPEPDGFSELGRIWLSTANVCERMRFAQHLLMTSGYTLKTTDGSRSNVSEPAKLIRLKLPSSSWNNPGAIVDYFLGILYPGEGPANLGLDRQAAIEFLTSNDAGVATPQTPFNLTTHESRVRGMIALLMCFPRFQEQ